MKKKSALIAALLMIVFVQFFSTSAQAQVEVNYENPCDRYGYVVVQNKLSLSGFTYNNGMLMKDARIFSPELAKVSVALSRAAYDYNQLEWTLQEAMGYTIVGGGRELYNRDYAGVLNNDFATYTISRKTIYYNEVPYGVYNVTVRGTYKSEWYSNFNLGTTGEHEGFYKGATLLYEELESLFDQDGLDKERRIVYLTGHSRGAAIANLVAGWMTDSQQQVAQNHLFCYTFACPGVSSNLTEQQTAYTNIYNLNNPGDLITAIPPEEWGYQRYGQTLLLDLNHKDNLVQRFKREKSDDYAGVNSTEDYISALLKLVPNEDAMQQPLSKFLFFLFAWKMGGKEETTLEDVAKAAGIEGINLIWDAQPINSIPKLLTKITGKIKGTVELCTFVREHSDAVQAMSPEELEQFLRTNAATITEIEKYTGYKISTADEFTYSILLLNEGDKTLRSVEEVIEVFLDLEADSNGNITDRFFDAHIIETYVMWINSMYFGHKGWYANDTLTELPVVDDLNIEIIGGGCFGSCAGLTSLTIPDSTRFISNSAFSGCVGLNEVIIPDGMKEIGNYAFSDCIALTSVDLSASVKSLWANAFQGCSGLRFLQIPISITVNATTFSGCNNIERVYYIPGRGEYYTDGLGGRTPSAREFVFAEGIEYIPSGFTSSVYYRDAKELSKVQFPTTLKHIGDNAFSKCSFVTLDFPEGLEEIGEKAFYGCASLTNLTLPQSVTEVPKSAFENCTGLQSVILHEGITQIDDKAFAGCYNLKELQIPLSASYSDGDSVEHSFYGCSGLERICYTAGNGTYFSLYKGIAPKSEVPHEIVFSEGISVIPANIAYMDYYLKEVQFPTTLKEIKGSAFSECYELKKVDFPEGLQEIGNHAFWGTGLESIEFPDSLQKIGSYAFESNDFSEVRLPGNLQSLENYAFSSCWNLKLVTIDSTLRSIPEGAFENCSLLRKINFSSGIERIERSAFSGCEALEEAKIPDSVEYVGGGSL